MLALCGTAVAGKKFAHAFRNALIPKLQAVAGQTTLVKSENGEDGDSLEQKTTSSAGTMSVGESVRLARVYASGVCDENVDLPLAHIRFLNFRAQSADKAGKR